MNTPREDGPAIAKLFDKIDGPVSFRQDIPEDIKAMVAPLGAIPVESLGRDEEGEGVNTDGDPEDGVIVGPINYAHKLHQAGEAATNILCGMAEAEFAGGNPNNMPEPILGWYCLTLVYQLCVFEAVEFKLEARQPHAEQLRAALNAFKRHHGEYANAVRADVAEALRTRFVPAALAAEDLSYGGVITGPRAA